MVDCMQTMKTIKSTNKYNQIYRFVVKLVQFHSSLCHAQAHSKQSKGYVHVFSMRLPKSLSFIGTRGVLRFCPMLCS